MQQRNRQKIINQNGSSFILILVSSMFFIIIALGAIELAQNQLRLNKRKIAQAQALQIAEAGINYYRWLLYHEEKHYFDVLGCAHDSLCNIGTSTYDDPFNPAALQGKYHLEVKTPKKNGSSVITLTSTGWTDDYPNLKKIIQVQLGKKSWSSYSLLSNSNIKIDPGYVIYGAMHSNGGIRMDGVAHGLVSSAVKKYFDPEHCGAEEYGVHTHTYEVNDGCNCPENPSTPNDCDSDERYDDIEFLAETMPNYYNNVFRAGRSFPVQPISFNILSSNLSEMMIDAESADGQIIDPTTMGCESNNDCDVGFRLVLNNNNYAVYNVETTNCDSYNADSESLQGVYSYPENGLIFVRGRDKLWVEGQIENNRITILAFNGAIEEGNADIIINNNINYVNSDGSEAIGLISQKDILVNKCISGNDLNINAALITKKGKILADEVSPVNNNLEINGSMATYNGFNFYQMTEECTNWVWGSCMYWSWGWHSAWVTIEKGYSNVTINYDTNLTYNPPPHFPTTGDYTFLSWKEK